MKSVICDLVIYFSSEMDVDHAYFTSENVLLNQRKELLLIIKRM